MSTLNLRQLFAPRSVALIGASERSGSVGQVVFRNLTCNGFRGTVYPVNPKYKTLGEIAVFPDVNVLPGTPELAVICTPAQIVPGLITALGKRGTRAAVVLSAGFQDAVSPTRQELLDAARPWGLRILGPNCIGFLNPRLKLNASFAHMDADAGSLAFVAQSGALCTAVIDWARANGVGFTHVISLGDMLDVDFGDVLDFLGNESATRGVLLYVEGITAPRKFLSAARAVSRNKPIIAIKAGRHDAGARAAKSHTGAMTGSYAVFESAFQRAGIVLVESIEAMFDAAETLALSRTPVRGDRLAILTNGGGPGVLAADAVANQGGQLAALAQETLNALDAVLPAAWSRANPVDIIGDANAERYRQALEILARDRGIDAILLIHVPTALLPGEQAAHALSDTISQLRMPVLTCWMGGATAQAARDYLAAAAIPAYETPQAAVSAFMTLVNHQRSQTLLMQTPPSMPEAFAPDVAVARKPINTTLNDNRELLTELEAKEVLRAYGFPVVDTRHATDTESAVALAQAIGYPVVLKLLSADVTHKSDVGGVALNLDSAQAVRVAADAILDRVRTLKPEARVAGFSVQRMIRRPRARELIVGSATDLIFGPLILFGDGGTAVEVLADKAIALPPLNMQLAHDLIRRTRVYKLLHGYRDQPQADLDAIALTLVRLSQLIIDMPEIVELDINPLLADNEGVIALDARIRVLRTDRKGAERLSIRPYPKELEEEITLPGGETLRIRPIRPEDEPAHRRFFEMLDPQDVYYRFFSYIHEFSHSQLARFTQIDYDREMAFIAVRPDASGEPETLGVVRAVADANNLQAEYGVVVRSDFQGKGLGYALMKKIMHYCRERGTGRLIGHILQSNRAMLDMARELGFVLDYQSDENVVIATLQLQ